MSKILAHISGPSGCGKTTLLNEMSEECPNIIFKDLDDFDDEAIKILKYQNVHKQKFTDKMLEKLAKKRQMLMDRFVRKAKKPIIFAGIHTEDKHVLNMDTPNRFRLNILPTTAAWRAYHRSQKGDPKYRRLKSEIPMDVAEAKNVIKQLDEQKYIVKPKSWIKNWIRKQHENL